MEKGELLELLCKLNEGIKDDQSFSEQFEENVKIILEKFSIDLDTNFNYIIDKHFTPEIKIEWNYITFSIAIIHNLMKTFEKSPEDILSVQQNKNLKNYFKKLLHVGIYTKLLPNLPLYVKSAVTYDNGDIFYNYNILKTTTLAFSEFLKCPLLRLIILSDYLRPILIACYQIAYCPLKKPSTDSKGEQKNTITENIYQQLTLEKRKFVNHLYHLQNSIHPNIFVKELMAIFYSNTPPWFKKAVSQNLTSIIKSKNGVENIATVLLDGAINDRSQTWKILDVISKLFLSCRSFPDFRETICNQLVQLLSKVSEDTLVYERMYVHCTKNLYKVEPDVAKDVLVRPVVSFFLFFTYKTHRFQENENVTNRLKQTSRIVHSLFIENNIELKKLPVNMLRPAVDVLFRFFTLTLNTELKSTNNELRGLLEGFLSSNLDNIFTIYDSFLFNIPSDIILPTRNDISISVSDQGIHLNTSSHSVCYSVSESSDALLELIKSRSDIKVTFFGYLLNCLVHKEKYFKKANEELMGVEEEFMNEHLERTLVVYKVLADLAEDKNVQKLVTEDPREIIRYCDSVLRKSIELKIHKVVKTDTEAFQSLFTVLMILQSLTGNCSKNNVGKYKILIEPLQQIYQETEDSETKNIITEISEIIDKGNVKATRMFVEEVKTKVDKALDDICDPLLPVRGHGLMTLAKLVEQKDENIMERKQYILNIFQQNLKNEDSYIYLSAIGGLAALGDIFPDTVINILCDEYSDATKKHNDDGHEVRIKIGESLLRVTKILGEMAPKYKSLLLNTFLNGAKDEDDLIRASSLSNLGEICRVLGYKLGTILTEVLVCVHAVITTDKSPQARRAAVTVLRQLFVGLESEMIAFLKEDILPIYRTLKEIYNNDKDDVVRLQAQLALEELNENMKNFVLPNPQLHTEKKIIMLN